MSNKKKKNRFSEIYNNSAFMMVMIISIFLLSYFSYNIAYDSFITKYSTSYLVKKKTIKSTYEIQGDLSRLKKISGEHFLYISYTGDKNVYNMEKDLNKLIKKYKLQDKFYYVNIDYVKNNNNRVIAVNELLGLTDAKVEKLPTIIYINKNNEIRRENIITRHDDRIMDLGDFQQLLDINDISK